MNIAVFGIGKLGTPLIAVLASKGYRVTGIDENHKTVNHLSFGRSTVREPGLNELLEENRDRIKATHVSECGGAINNSQIIFVVVPTLSNQDGSFSCECVEKVAQTFGRVLSASAEYKLLVLVSTVAPGDTEKVFIRTVERYSGKDCGIDFGVCYNPEFIALGSVIADMLSPDLVLIGEADKRSGDILQKVSARVCPMSPVIRMNIISAEVAKLSLNCYITTKISYANTIAELCDKLPGADSTVVTTALGLDNRIGSRCLKPATAYGGPCFPRDNLAMIHLMYRVGCVPSLAEATNTVNRRQTARLVEEITEMLPRPNAMIGILGTAYKPDTDIIEESASIYLIEALVQLGLRVVTFDPKASLSSDATTAQKCVTGSDVVVLMLPYQEFAELDYTGKIVIDCWHLLGAKR